jgi:hypothetical protein
MERYFDVVLDRRGNAIQGATVTIKTAAGATATIYSDDGVTTVGNPLTTNADGEFTFFAANGKYTVEVVAEGYGAESKSDTVLYDPSDVEMSVNDVTTATYSLSVTDIGQWLDVNTSATATVSITTASGYAVADWTIIRQKGAGQVVLTAPSGTIDSFDAPSTRGQKAVIAITRVNNGGSGTATYSVYGNMA